MARPFRMTLMLVPLALGCGSTWDRQSAVKVPLHQSVWGLQPKDPPCTLEKEEWEEKCNSANYNKMCPPGCPLSKPDDGPKRK